MKVTQLNYDRCYCNTYVIGEEGNSCFVIDPGYNKNNVLGKYLKKNYKDVEGFILTHGHYDHIEGLATLIDLYPKASIIIHELEERFLYKPKLNGSAWNGQQELKIEVVTNNVVDNDIICLLDNKIKVIHTPFHTSGSMCLYLEKEKILFTGDTLFARTIGRSDLPTGSENDIYNSLMKLSKLPTDVVIYPGHGPKSTLEIEFVSNSYFKNIL